jgi:hypothetical protein
MSPRQILAASVPRSFLFAVTDLSLPGEAAAFADGEVWTDGANHLFRLEEKNPL